MTTEESNITIYDPLTAGNKVSIDADTKTETNVVVDKVSIEDEIEKLQNKKNNYATEYARLTNRFERALIEHKLAVEYFEFRSFYFEFLPVTIIATFVTIIGFLISGSGSSPENDDGEAQNSIQYEPLLTGHTKQMWSVAVGVLGAITTLLNAIGKRTNYQSQTDMHRSAVKALEKICLTVNFETDWFLRNAYSEDLVNDTAEKIAKNPERRHELVEKLAPMLAADLKTHQASFQAMQDACSDSPVPTRVIQAFLILDQLTNPKVTTQSFYYHKLWKEFSTYQWWPLKAPRIDVLQKIREWEKATQGNQNDREPAPGNGDVSAQQNALFCCYKTNEPLLVKNPSYGATNV